MARELLSRIKEDMQRTAATHLLIKPDSDGIKFHGNKGIWSEDALMDLYEEGFHKHFRINSALAGDAIDQVLRFDQAGYGERHGTGYLLYTKQNIFSGCAYDTNKIYARIIVQYNPGDGCMTLTDVFAPIDEMHELFKQELKGKKKAIQAVPRKQNDYNEEVKEPVSKTSKNGGRSPRRVHYEPPPWRESHKEGDLERRIVHSPNRSVTMKETSYERPKKRSFKKSSPIHRESHQEGGPKRRMVRSPDRR